MKPHRAIVGHLLALKDYCEREGHDGLRDSLTKAIDSDAPRQRSTDAGAKVVRLAQYRKFPADE